MNTLDLVRGFHDDKPKLKPKRVSGARIETDEWQNKMAALLEEYEQTFTQLAGRNRNSALERRSQRPGQEACGLKP